MCIDATPSDFNEVFKKHFNENFQPTKNFDEFLKGCKDEMEHFQPPGKMIAQFKHYGKNIEIYNVFFFFLIYLTEIFFFC